MNPQAARWKNSRHLDISPVITSVPIFRIEAQKTRPSDRLSVNISPPFLKGQSFWSVPEQVTVLGGSCPTRRRWVPDYMMHFS
jgi:hypothetical protein